MDRRPLKKQIITAMSLTLLATLITLGAGCGGQAQKQAAKGKVKVSGSTSVLPSAQEAAAEYSDANPGVRVDVQGGGSSVGITQIIQGIVDINSQAATTLITSRHFSGFARGIDITVTLDESAFVGSGMVLFGAVLERFFALYCGPNNFTRLTLRSRQQEQEIARWPARTGEALVI